MRVASPTGHAEVFPLVVVEVASSADIAGAAPPAVARVASPAVIVEVMSSTDPVGFVALLERLVYNVRTIVWLLMAA